MKLSTLYEDITPQDIYSFYAITGAGVEKELQELINNISKELYEEVESTVKTRLLSLVVGDTLVIPKPKDFEKFGGKPSIIQKIVKKFKNKISIEKNRKINRRKKEVEIYGEIKGEFTNHKFNQKFQELAKSLSEQEIDSIIEYSNNFGSYSLIVSGHGVWSETWKKLKTLKDKIYGNNLNDKIIATDIIFGMTHHTGSLIGISSKEIAGALNAKFNASTISDFWDKINPRLRILINKLRREKAQDTIKLNQDRPENLFDYNWHEHEHKVKNIYNKKDIIASYKSGMTVKEIAMKYDLTIEEVNKIIKNNDVKRPRINRNYIIQLYKNGHGAEEISEIANLDIFTTASILFNAKKIDVIEYIRLTN